LEFYGSRKGNLSKPCCAEQVDEVDEGYYFKDQPPLEVVEDDIFEDQF